ncbi:MAG TPA: MarR family transcriptional regulator [Jatrophihabitantaceae bacterium]|nr:MarR family transcriptional regulator [Jatrophihabitantaceae bacterium]
MAAKTVAAAGSPVAETGTALDRTGAGDALTDLVVKTFRLHGLFLEAAEQIARPAGLTAAWWQVLGAVLDQPRSVASIAREMGLARQSVQRVADLLAARGLIEYRPNPAHQRAKLVTPTSAGRAAIDSLAATQHEWANRVAGAVGEDDLSRAVAVVDDLIAALS